MWNPRSMIAPTLVGVAFGIGGCTTDSSLMVDNYNQGRFAEAAIAGDEAFAVLRQEGSSRIDKLGEVRSQDQLWIGIEKAKILGDAGRFGESFELFRWVDDRQTDAAVIETLFAENPLNADSWDASQFTEDVGQAVVGADQTTYVVQPYEAILARSYGALSGMFAEGGQYAQFAQRSQELQSDWQRNLGLEFVSSRTAPTEKMDRSVSGGVESGIDLGGFSVANILNVQEFGRAKQAMATVIAEAGSANASSPFVPSASIINWAAFVKDGNFRQAGVASQNVERFTGATDLATALQQAAKSPDATDKVVVFVGAGRGPVRDFFSVRVPIPIPEVGNGYYRGVYPVLEFRGQDTCPERISVGGQALEVIDSVDAIAAQNFQLREPSLWWTPTVRGTIRAVASIVAQAADGESGGIFDLAILGANVIMAEAEQADVRMWSSLPAMHFAAVVDRPADGNLVVDLASETGSGSVSVEVPEGLSFVYVRALEPGLATAHSVSLRK